MCLSLNHGYKLSSVYTFYKEFLNYLYDFTVQDMDVFVAQLITLCYIVSEMYALIYLNGC